MVTKQAGKARERSVTFYADPDVKEYLDALTGNKKTRVINEAIRLFMDHNSSDFQNRLAKIEERLDALENKA